MTALEFQGLLTECVAYQSLPQGWAWAQVVKRPSPRTHTQQPLRGPWRRLLLSGACWRVEGQGGTVPPSYLPCFAQSSFPQELCPWGSYQ